MTVLVLFLDDLEALPPSRSRIFIRFEEGMGSNIERRNDLLRLVEIPGICPVMGKKDSFSAG